MSSRYQNISNMKSYDGKIIYSQNYYPSFNETIDNIYIITTEVDRLDLIALDFWGDDKLWWVLVMVNNLDGDSIYPPIGYQLKIPKNINNIIDIYNKENE